jgi:hypothetical protein
MTLDLDASHLSIVVSLTTLAGLIGFIIKNSIKFGALELKVDTMWAFQMRRAMSEVVATGIGTMNSPLLFSDMARDALDPIKDDLINYYNHHLVSKGDADALLEIEREFGETLLTNVCIPCKLSHGACLLLALSVAKKIEKLEVHI